MVVEAINHGRHFLKLLSKHTKKLVRIDLTQKVYNLAKKLDTTAFKNQPDEAWKIIKRLVAFSPGNKHSHDGSLPMPYDDDLAPVSTHSRKLEVFFEHFAKLEMADSMTAEQLLQGCCSVGPTAVDFIPSACNIMGPLNLVPASLANLAVSRLLGLTVPCQNLLP